MTNIKDNRLLSTVLISLITLTAIVAIFFVDQRGYFGIHNFWNIIPNIPFLVVGIIGVRRVLAGISVLQ